jgi:hypothetical protein
MISNIFKNRLRNSRLTSPDIEGGTSYPGRVTKTVTGSLSLAECYGTVIDNYGQAASMTLTMPAACSQINFQFEVVTTGFAIYIKAAPGDKFYHNGVALDDGDKIGVTSPVVGDCIWIEGMRTGASTYDLRSISGQKDCLEIAYPWVDSGA